MKRTFAFVLGGLLVAGIIHIAIVFMVPLYASNDAWGQMKQFGRDGQFHVLALPLPGAEPLAALDPRIMHAACRFSLVDGPVRIQAALPDDFWSIAIFDRRGRNIYSLNDRSAERSQLDLAILTPVQMARLRQDPPASLETAVVLVEPIDVGFGLIRVFVADETRLTAATTALNGADCAAPI